MTQTDEPLRKSSRRLRTLNSLFYGGIKPYLISLTYLMFALRNFSPWLVVFWLSHLTFGPTIAAEPAGIKESELTAEQQAELAQAKQLNQRVAILFKQGQYKDAIPLAQQALSIRQRILGEHHPTTANSLFNLGGQYFGLGDYETAERLYRAALAIYQQVERKKYVETAMVLTSLGQVRHIRGDYASARSCLEQALAIYKEVLGKKHVDTAWCLSHLGNLLQEQGDLTAARVYLEQALAIRKELLGEKHLATARSRDDLGGLLKDQGDYALARQYYAMSLAIHIELLGKENRETATALNNLGSLLFVQRDYVGARLYLEQALAINRTVLGQTHPDTAMSLNNVGILLSNQGDFSAARPYLVQSLGVYRELFGETHPYTAIALGNLGYLATFQADYQEAQQYLEQALTIRNDLLGAKNADTAKLLQSLGCVLLKQRKFDAAWIRVREAAKIKHELAEALFSSVSEAEALNYASTIQEIPNALISAWMETQVPAKELYAELWPGRGAVMRLTLQRRQALARIDDPVAIRLYQEWLETRSQLARVLLAPISSSRQSANYRAKVLELTNQKEDIERQLARLLPEFADQQANSRRTPADLVDRLPQGSALIDFVRYSRYQQDPDKPGEAGVRWIPSYAAFVLAEGQEVAFVDLGRAARIDAAASGFRKSIMERTQSPAGEELRRLIWQPLEKTFPKSVQTVLIAPAATLASLPWAALPGDQPGSVLLERYAVAVVPSAPYLLEQSEQTVPSTRATGSILVVGDVQYDAIPSSKPDKTPSLVTTRSVTLKSGQPPRWPALAGTRAELAEVLALAGKRTVVTLAGTDANTSRVRRELPQVRWATFATHGFFADPSFRSAFQLDEREFEQRDFLAVGERTTPAGRNPLVLSGLILAGANLPRTTNEWGAPQDDGGVLSGESIAGLDLHRLELAVLSACDTGLGDVAGGEGVLGLQRAFHVAGCHNVIASLWKVDDQATAALMKLFYYKVWQENMAPLVALREAQLAIYRHPEEIKSLATTRGPDFAQTVKLADQGRKAPDRVAPTDMRLWAGFVLSGTGR